MTVGAKATIEARFTVELGSKLRRFQLGVDLTLPGEGVTAIFGASGSGKTTLLRCIAGLQKVADGKLVVNGAVWQQGRTVVPTHKRPLGYVFQESSLFTHLTAEGNLNYALKRSGNADMPERKRRLVELLGLDALLQQHPAQLSGGERQRVAIARALLIDPRVLLMDEPLASLDEPRRQEVLPYLQKLRQEFNLPILYVSHNLDEVARLADYIVVLEQGTVVAQGPLLEVLARLDMPIPLGEEAGVVVPVTVKERDVHWHLLRVCFPGGHLWVRDGGECIGEQVRVRILARDVSLSLGAQEQSSILNRLQAQVEDIAPDADKAMVLVRLRLGGVALIARITHRSAAQLQVQPGLWVWVQIKSVAVVR